MAAVPQIPERKTLTSLKTHSVKKLTISTDANRNRVSFELWDATFRACVGTHYSRQLDEECTTLKEYANMFPRYTPEDLGTAYANALQSWDEDGALVAAAIISTCDFDGDPSGEYLGDLLGLANARPRYDYLKAQFMDVSSHKKQDELSMLWPTLPILPADRPVTKDKVAYNIKTSYRNWLLIEGNVKSNIGQFVRHVYRRLSEDPASAGYVGQLEAISRATTSKATTLSIP